MTKLILSVSRNLLHHIINIPGWRTKRKIVVIESDDWGSIRMPSCEVLKKFQSCGYDLAKSDYNRLDTLESNEDLIRLFEVLYAFTDNLGNHPLITANMVVGNPDFSKIRESDFSAYFYEPVKETLKRYPDRDQVLSLWKAGMTEGIFFPQFHSREHVNTVRWMEALRERSLAMMFSFDNQTTFSGNGDYNFMEVLDYNSPEDLNQMKESLLEGLDLFEEIFGYRSESFIPPCYTWSSELEETLFKGGIKYIQGLVVQSIPTGKFGRYKSKYNFLGKTNSHGQYYLNRNCFFEPALSRSPAEVDKCLQRVSIAFRCKKPAVISSHRINFIGALDRNNRETNLLLFRQLLGGIIRKWPDVEFMSSVQLGDLIAKNGKK